MEALGPSARNCFATDAFDRCAARRTDDVWLGERLRDPETRFVPLAGGRVLVTRREPPAPVLLPATSLLGRLERGETMIFLGERDARAHFALDLGDDDAAHAALAPQGAFRELKAVGAALEPAHAGLLAYARGMAYWHRRHRHCGDCGVPTESVQGGHLRLCRRCGARQFPRTDPAVIVRVEHGRSCLLARQRGWPEDLYSVVAGFVEPGESLEGAVAREVEEETGVVVRDIRYCSSQPWPFPSSLMLGFSARALGAALTLGDDELADAQWLTREGLARALEAGRVRLSSPVSIAFRLVEEWFDAEAGPGALAARTGGERRAAGVS